MFEPLADWLRRRRERAELGTLDAAERDRIANDLGVSAAELDYLVRESHDPLELPRMLKALGIDEAAVKRAQPALLRDLERTCSVCEQTSMCQFALSEGLAELTYREFCPNADVLTAVRKARPAY